MNWKSLLATLLTAFTVSFALLAFHTFKANRIRRRYVKVMEETLEELRKVDQRFLDQSAGDG